MRRIDRVASSGWWKLFARFDSHELFSIGQLVFGGRTSLRNRRDSSRRAHASSGPEVQSKICQLRRKFAGLVWAAERSCGAQFSGDRNMIGSVIARVAALKTTTTPDLKVM